MNTPDVVIGGLVGVLITVAILTFAHLSLMEVADTTGYRRGYCEGRGGVEATVGDSIRCIRPPVAVDTSKGGVR